MLRKWLDLDGLLEQINHACDIRFEAAAQNMAIGFAVVAGVMIVCTALLLWKVRK